VHAAIMADGKLSRYVVDKTIVKTHFVPNRIVNFIVR
jgi:hypothetical protein